MPCHNQPRHAPGSLTAVSPMAKPVFLSPESCLWWDTTQSEHSPLPRCPGSAPLDQAVAAQWGPAGGFLSPLWSSQFGPESRKPMLSSPIFRPSRTPKPPTGRQASSGRAGLLPLSAHMAEFGNLQPISSLWLCLQWSYLQKLRVSWRKKIFESVYLNPEKFISKMNPKYYVCLLLFLKRNSSSFLTHIKLFSLST